MRKEEKTNRKQAAIGQPSKKVMGNKLHKRDAYTKDWRQVEGSLLSPFEFQVLVDLLVLRRSGYDTPKKITCP